MEHVRMTGWPWSRRDRDATDKRPSSFNQTNTANDGGTVYANQGTGNQIVNGDPTAPSRDTAGPPTGGDRIRVLMRAANPASTARLALDEEAREIGEKLRLARDRDMFELITQLAVRPTDLLRCLNEFRPRIVHFSGHGDRAGQIVLSAGGGSGQPVDAPALAELFRVMRQDIRVVVLSACHSGPQARAIGAHIDYVVGMRATVYDGAATVFAAEFYSALGFQRTIPEAFEQAVVAVRVHGLRGYDMPELIARPGADPRLTIDVSEA
jgi:hypothetical protein